MSFRQTYKGIFQFKDQHTLERAMAENQAEAIGADALGLQDCYHAPGVMLIDIDAVASLQDWEEMAVAIATLAMHASKGFCYALAYDGGETGPRKEYYSASGERIGLDNDSPAPATEADYFPLQEGATYRYRPSGLEASGDVVWTVRKVKAGAESYYYFEDADHLNIHYNDYWDGTYYRKRGAYVDAAMAGNEKELHGSDAKDRYALQPVYHSLAQSGDALFAIWKEGDHFLEFAVEGFVDLDLPIGKLQHCMKIRMDLYHVMGSEMYRETQHQFFAQGHGLVKWDKGGASLQLAGRA